MIDPELLSILCCPETHADLILASPEQVDLLNQAIREQRVKNRSGQTIHESIDEALIRIDHRYAYPVRNEIPVMLIDEALSLDGLLTAESEISHHAAALVKG